MEFLIVVIMGSLFALIFTGYRMFSKKDWSYGGTDYDGKKTRDDARSLFVLLVIGFVVLWYFGSNNPG